ncbi:MAG: 50S ribosomal protein L6 [Gammaproteobacteria bacterium]|nr:50S ribosomal protein L6 [Gammaproteobacteria bacterium]
MSRVANNPVSIPSGVEVKVNGQRVDVKGSKGQIGMDVHQHVEVVQEDDQIKVAACAGGKASAALAGTTRALVANMVTGVSEGFERKLQLQGVGYRAQAQGKKLNLQLGFSHPVEYELPEGIEVSTPSQTEIVVTGINKQLVGQVSAEIRAFRPPEPYKGKGVRYEGERVRRKEAKKK